MNSPLENQLLTVLTQLAETVKTMPSVGVRPSLLPLFHQIDEFTGQLPRNTDPTLMHYLHKKSYEKARLFLQGRGAENQLKNCRHVT